MSAIDILIDAGYDDTVIFDSPAYDDALLGVTPEGCAVYSYERMVAGLMTVDGMTEEEATEWIEYNTLRSLPYYEGAPIVMHELAELF